MGDMPEGSVILLLHGHLENYVIEDFWPGRRVTWCHTALGASLVPDGPELRAKERTGLYKIR